MATIDLAVDTEIAAAPADVAAVMFDAQRESEWMKAIVSTEVIDPALKVGARVRHTAAFLGREITWTTEVVAVHFPHRLSLQIADGPFVGTVSYEIARTPAGSHVRIRNVGEPGSFGFLPKALIEAPMRSSITADLARLKVLVEQPAAVS